GVGALGGAAAEARVHADDRGALRKGAAVAVELVERAGVVEDAQRDELLEPAGRHLRGELDARGGEAGAERALDLGVARGVDVEPEVAEQPEDGVARVRLHRVAQREPEGLREGERGARRGLERRAIVDVARGAEPLAHQGRPGPATAAAASARTASSSGCRPRTARPTAAWRSTTPTGAAPRCAATASAGSPSSSTTAGSRAPSRCASRPTRA